MRTLPRLAIIAVLAVELVPSLGRAAPRDHAPFVSTINNTTVNIGSGLAAEVRATDADGDRILSFTASNLPPNCTFSVTDSTNTDGGFEWTPTTVGNFFPVFTACNALCGTATVFLTSCNGFYGYLTAIGSNQSLKLSGGANNTWCVQVQPSYQSTADKIIPSSILLHSDGTGSVSQIAADPGSTGALSDKTNDGIQEMTACFARADLRRLFSNITAPTTTYLVLTADLAGGGTVTANLVLPVSP